MSEWLALRRTMIVVAAACCFSGSLQAQAPAQALANKFAAEPDRARAKTKQAARPDKRTHPTAAAKARAKAARAAELAHYIAEVRKAEEADMLARARREAQDMHEATEERRLIRQAEREREKAEAPAAADPAIQPAMPLTQPTGTPPEQSVDKQQPAGVATAKAIEEAPPPAVSDSAKIAEQEERARQRAQESQHLLAKLRRARRIRDARLAAAGRRDESPRLEPTAVPSRVAAAPSQPPPPIGGSDVSDVPPAPPPQSETVAAAPPAPGTSSGTAALGPPDEDEVAEAVSEPRRATAGLRERRVTVLLVMAPGNRGMRRHNKSADPVLCVTYGCYVSAGPAWPARFMPGHRALGILNTWGARAGACRDSLECVFRAIEVVELPGYLQPVDLRLLRHDRRRPQMITGDSACTVERGRLLCSRGIYAEDYAMWVVPESIAAAAGPDALQRAAAEGLRRPQMAGLAPRP